MFGIGDEVYWNDYGVELHGDAAQFLVIDDIYDSDDDPTSYCLWGEDCDGNLLRYVAEDDQFE